MCYMFMQNYTNFHLLVFYDEICVTYIKLIMKIKAYKIIFRFLLKLYFNFLKGLAVLEKLWCFQCCYIYNYCCGVFLCCVRNL